MKIILIASVSKNGYIGKNNKLMWNIPNDLKRFKNLTIGETILMGRKTFDSIGKILPGRKNVILTRKIHKNNIKHHVQFISSIKCVKNIPCKKLFVIGGGEIYTSLLKEANIIELTKIHKNFFGDTKFPKINMKKWKKIHELFYEENHTYNYSLIRFERIKK
ncbi:dihydrofolate reductase [Blattabacterium cuenoti]|uniref:dihydrofolate reductase n=1 Tax=Blattabacterium cuenoti TaxID=1653831 RepID=UPI00163CAC04|nr:dihydrofolate reductase [Blattabacterium cuenoti]